MKTMILSTVIALLIASPVHASPLTWFFFGTVTVPSEYHGTPIAGHSFELQIFLDTDVVGFHFGSEVSFGGAMGEVKITGLDPIGLRFTRVAYGTTGNTADRLNVTAVFYDQIVGSAEPSGQIKFDSPIVSLDRNMPLHLTPIERHEPSADFNTLLFGVPDGNGSDVVFCKRKGHDIRRAGGRFCSAVPSASPSSVRLPTAAI
jgi:hypothetical protein